MAHPFPEIQVQDLNALSQVRRGNHYSGGEMINAATNPLKANRYLVTLIHRYSGEEKLLDMLIDGQGFTAVIQEVRRHVRPVWELAEVLDCDEPF